MSAAVRRLWQDCRGGPAAEFALVLPLLILFLFGIIDVGRLMWTWNQAEKAAQMGVRLAVVTAPVASGLTSYSYATAGTVSQGNVVPQSLFGGIRCNNSTCTCLNQSGTCPFGTTRNGTAFTAIVTRMAGLKSDIAAANVVIDYTYSGLGFAGDPNGPDVAPLVTVKLQNLHFAPLILFGGTISLSAFSSTLTMEGSA
jgi:Flp pilus assembly protein TadG